MNQLRDALIAYNDYVYRNNLGLSKDHIDAFLSSPSAKPFIDEGKEKGGMLWGCYMEGTDEKGISDDILLSVHSTPAGAHENSLRMQKEYGGKHYTDKVVIHA